MSHARKFILLITLALSATGLLLAEESDLTLIRNNDIQSLDPVTPPMDTLFDPGTGGLLGEAFTQSFEFAYHDEALFDESDGPLVLYQLSDPNHTLFFSKVDDVLSINSYPGDCQTISPLEMSALAITVPRLNAEIYHALDLYGISDFPGGVLCTDDQGIGSVASYPFLITADNTVAVVYYRDSLDTPTAYVFATSPTTYDFFNSEGGFRVDLTDEDNPVFIPLDANGVEVPPSPLTPLDVTDCQQAGLEYYQCLSHDPVWLATANIMVDETMDVDCGDGHCGAVTTTLKCSLMWIDPTAYHAANCVTRALLGFPALIISGTGNLLHDCEPSIPPGEVLCPPPPGSSAECVSPATCTLDGASGFAHCEFPSTAPGSCTHEQDCGGPGYCEAAICNPSFETETCDDYDNDCNGTTDSFPTSCGTGACASEGVCEGGIDSCEPGDSAPDDTTCDGVDDDCDGETDEDYVSVPTACGVGACASTGATLCLAGVVEDSCVPGTPTTETCDGIDNDCNGTVDDGCASEPQCLRVSGAGWVEAPDSPTLGIQGDLTIEFWAYIEGGSTCTWGAISDQCFPAVTKWRDGAYSNRGYFLDCRVVNGQVPRFDWHPGCSVYGPGVMSFLEWHHYAAVRDGTQNYIYIDGALVASEACSDVAISDVPEPVRIGRGLLYNTDAYAIGLLDEVRLWNVARSQSDIQAHRFGLTLPQPGLVGYWTFNETAGEALDSSGNQNHATFNGDADRIPCSYP